MCIDGLLEPRREHLDAGLERLAHTLGAISDARFFDSSDEDVQHFGPSPLPAS
jgi:hypothetical protein